MIDEYDFQEIADRLRKIYPNKHVNFEVSFNIYRHGSEEFDIRVYVEDTINKHFDTLTEAILFIRDRENNILFRRFNNVL